MHKVRESRKKEILSICDGSSVHKQTSEPSTAADTDSQTEDPIYNFVKANKGMVYEVARKVLGMFNPDEIMNEAYFAARICIMNKRDPFKKSHGQTVFYWYLCKQFIALRNTVGVFDETSAASYSDTDLHDDIEAMILDEDVDCSKPADYHDDQSEGHPDNHTLTNKFIVYAPSLHNILPSRALEVLRLLSHGCDDRQWKNKLQSLKAFYKCGSPLKLRKSICLEISEAVQKSGASLYRANCKNGSYNTVLLAARSTEEAISILPKKFGKLIQIDHYEVNSGN